MSDFLLKFVDALPKRVAFEMRPYSEVRREFLSFIQQIDSKAFCLLYLVGESNFDSIELVLSNSSFDPKNDIVYPKVRRIHIPISQLQSKPAYEDLIISLGINDWLKALRCSNFIPHISVLNGAQYSASENSEAFVEQGIIGVVAAFFPPEFKFDSDKLVAIRFAKRLLIGDIVNSRLERSTLAANEILQLIRVEKDFFKSINNICEIFNKYTRSMHTLAFKVEGREITYEGSSEKIGDKEKKILSRSVPTYEFFKRAVESKTVRAGISPLPPMDKGNSIRETTWLVAPCVIDAVQLSEGGTFQPSETSFLVFVLIGKSSPYYLGVTYSSTDVGIARKLCSIISTHIPAAIASTLIQDVSDVFIEDTKGQADSATGQDPSRRLMHLAKKLDLGISSVIYIDLVPESDDSEVDIFSTPPLSEFGKGILIKTLTSANFKKKGTETRHIELMGEHYLSWDISTDYRPKRYLLINIGDRDLPAYLYRVLKSFVENYYLSLRSEDFYVQQTATLAQIRHAVRGPLAAAMSVLELMASRFARYKSLPTKFARIMDTPTMKEWIPDALLYTQQAYVIADSARYLLGAVKPEDIRWGDLDMVQLVKSVIDVMSSETSRRDLKVSFEPPVPDHPFIVSADRMLIWTVIFNLLDNAVKYSYAGRRITVRISVEADGQKWRFSVINFGVPILDEEKKRIFLAWTRSRVKDVGRRRPGTGLGLAVSRYILSAHDDKALLDVESEMISESPYRTARTEFFFTLPIKGKVQHEAAEIARLTS